MSEEVRICSSCWEEDCVCDYERYITLDEGIADAMVTLNLKGYRTTYSCEGHIIEDDGDTKSKLLYIYFVCPNHRFETLPEGFMYPKGKRHNQIYRELLYKYVNGKMLARINGKYIPYDVKSDHQEHLEALRIWAENLPAIDIKKHPECYSEYMVTGKPQASYLKLYELPMCDTFCITIIKGDYEATTQHIVGYGGKVLEVKEIDDQLTIYYWAKEDLFAN